MWRIIHRQEDKSTKASHWNSQQIKRNQNNFARQTTNKRECFNDIAHWSEREAEHPKYSNYFEQQKYKRVFQKELQTTPLTLTLFQKLFYTSIRVILVGEVEGESMQEENRDAVFDCVFG